VALELALSFLEVKIYVSQGKKWNAMKKKMEVDFSWV
jgi:hypothetical protein